MDTSLFDPYIQEVLAVLLTALAGVLTTAITLGAKWLIEWIKVKLSAERYAFAQSAVQTIVRFIEQTAVWDTALREGYIKKEKAMALALQWAEDNSVPLTRDMLDKMVEEAVNVMNANLGGISFEETAIEG